MLSSLLGLSVIGLSAFNTLTATATARDSALDLADADQLYELAPLSVQAVEHYRAVSTSSPRKFWKTLMTRGLTVR